MIKKSDFRKTLIFTSILLLSIVMIVVLYFYNIIYANNTNLKKGQNFNLYISTGSNFGSVIDSLSANKVLIDTAGFIWVANKKSYITKVKAGRFLIKSSMSNNEIVNMLRIGAQEPINLTFNNIRTKEELASAVSKKIELDSIDLINLLNDDDFLKEYHLNKKNVLSMFIPNTYQFYWNTSADYFLKKMNAEYKMFWTKSRLEKAKKLKMNLVEISTLASIVQAEQSVHNSEKAKVAGLYINRLKKGMLLQSDPTVVYAIGDFSIRRVLNRDKEIDSPYNTYKYVGLPPAPINLPEISSIDAVLNYEKHNYIFMCAKDDFSGYHYFSTNTTQHNLYARLYQNALNKRGIKR
ncbi:MAG: endolytic transglycosylase MltG [Bacteroidales bacterium]|nr:endolytic transglycosylase MltG [Bacteroidales bacterium]MBN2758740.1 endolytic transglycosylase MltG [Bacteroidales bacterium]